MRTIRFMMMLVLSLFTLTGCILKEPMTKPETPRQALLVAEEQTKALAIAAADLYRSGAMSQERAEAVADLLTRMGVVLDMAHMAIQVGDAESYEFQYAEVQKILQQLRAMILQREEDYGKPSTGSYQRDRSAVNYRYASSAGDCGKLRCAEAGAS